MTTQMVPQQYTMAAHYAPAYSPAPTQAHTAPIAQHIVTGMPYTGYEGLTDMSSPFPIKQEPRQHFEQMPQPSMQHPFYALSHRDVKPSMAELSPPSSRRGSDGSIMMSDMRIVSPSKTIRANKTYDPSHDVSFSTPVDEMMKVLDPERKAMSQLPTPGASPKSERADNCSSPVSPCGSSAPSPSVISSTSDPKTKKYYCDGPDCDAVFHQKVHLKTHKATHTGVKEHVSTRHLLERPRH